MIYFPMTADIITPGHIKCIKFLRKRGGVVIGLLTDEALKGYKENVNSYEDRKYVLEAVAKGVGYVTIVPQETLDPTKNLKKYKCDGIASGDGWETEELVAIKRLKIEEVNISLRGEGEKRYSSSGIRAKLE